eukprot:TRINITY_DN2206_c0_g1_i1.p1 TRINITY_DN2206_c0_g1~~TRINITY_DN2206_c0_g1_i1.p1  ORF type:complete len:653 (+),score=139.25 TRINITY_DN2206_c0_g1_i1:134-2092(+)
MISASMASFSAALDLVQNMSGELVQEMVILAVFGISFVSWRTYQKLMKNAAKVVNWGGGHAQKLAQQEQHGAPALHEMAKQKGGRAAQGRLASTPTDAARNVRKFSEVDKAKVMAAEPEILKFMQQNEFTRALNMYRGFERQGFEMLFSEHLFTTFVQSATRVGKVDVAERMMRVMKRANIIPSLEFWQHTMKLFSSRRQYGLCLTTYEILGHQCPADKVVFSCIINAALEQGVAERTPRMLAKFAQAGISGKDHVLFFRCYVALGDVASAEALFMKLGKQASTLMLNLLLLTCVNAKEPERAWDMLQYARKLEQAGDTDGIVDIVSYNTVMKGFGATKNRQRCFQCIQDLVDHGLQPDDITLGSILDTCIADNDLAVANEIGNLLLSSGRQISNMMWTLFIKGLVRAGTVEKAVALYKEMKKRGVQPDLITYSVLIKGLADQHDIGKAMELVDDLKAQGLVIDDIILTHLLEGCRHANNFKLGKQIFKEAMDAGMKPSDVTLVTMLKLYGRAGEFHEAFEMVKTWEHVNGSKPSVIHYTCLMSGCLRSKSYDQAWESFELMLASGIEPDQTTIATLLPGMVTAQHWDHVLILARKATQASGSQPPVEALNHALSHMRASRSAGRSADALQALMRTAGIWISTRNGGSNCNH